MSQEKLRSSVPSSRDIVSHDLTRIVGVLSDGSSQTEVTDGEVAVSIDEQVSRFLVKLVYQVSVNNVGRMHVLHTSEDLVDEELDVAVTERLWTLYDGRQISIHQIRYDIEVVKGLPRSGKHNGIYAEDLFETSLRSHA